MDVRAGSLFTRRRAIIDVEGAIGEFEDASLHPTVSGPRSWWRVGDHPEIGGGMVDHRRDHTAEAEIEAHLHHDQRWPLSLGN